MSMVYLPDPERITTRARAREERTGSAEMETETHLLDKNECKNRRRDLEEGSSDIITLVIAIFMAYNRHFCADEYNTICLLI